MTLLIFILLCLAGLLAYRANDVAVCRDRAGCTISRRRPALDPPPPLSPCAAIGVVGMFESTKVAIPIQAGPTPRPHHR